jgi:P pilus assembly chaperone PapD
LSMNRVQRASMLGLVAPALILASAPARAELVLSELIVELQPGKQVRDDIEIWNNSPERSFVAIEPREVLDPGLPSQSVHQDPDPQKLGLLVSPNRMILEPGQRKLVRMATLSPSAEHEHVYRVTIKPLVAGIQTSDSGLKVIVGYDVLVLVRPAQPLPNVTATRNGKVLTFSNAGNVSVELIDGRECSGAHTQCTELPGKRLYPGASWRVDLHSDLPAEYTLRSPGRTDHRTY